MQGAQTLLTLTKFGFEDTRGSGSWADLHVNKSIWFEIVKASNSCRNIWYYQLCYVLGLKKCESCPSLNLSWPPTPHPPYNKIRSASARYNKVYQGCRKSGRGPTCDRPAGLSCMPARSVLLSNIFIVD